MSHADNLPAKENPRNIEFYNVDPSVIADSARELLHEYSGLANDQIDGHVEAIRLKAFNIWPYPCIGMFRFLDLSMMSTDVYPEVLERVKNGEQFLDLGCCFGQEIRRLVFDGAPSANTHGSDLRAEFISLGYDLFRDKDRLQTEFLTADVFDDTSALTQLAGKMNIIYTGSFFHLFDLADQERVALRVVQLLAPQPGSLVIGRQVGSEQAREYARQGYGGEQKRFRHNEQSWKEMWDRVGEKTGSKWSVTVKMDASQFGLRGPEVKLSQRRSEPDAVRLMFVVKRL